MNDLKEKKVFDKDIEIIVKIIIEKLLINSIYFSERKNEEEKIINLCHYFIKKQINSIIKILDIKYDKDDNNLIEKNYEIKEPNKIIKDRYFENNIKNNLIHEIQEKNSESENLLSLNRKTSYFSSPINNSSKYKNKKIEKNNDISISSFTVFDINEKEFLKPEVENIKQLRENQTLIDKLKEKKKKFKFHKSSQIESINIKEEPIKEENKKLINFNSEKFTFDSNGKVISKLNLNNNIFQQNFITIKSNLKLIKEISNYSKENNNEINTTSSLNKTKIIYNDNNFINKFKNKLNFLPGFENILLKKKENFCPPSGDNFQLIEPEFGVIVKDNNNNIKEGIYNKKERKLSLNEYHKISETVLKKNKSEKLIFQSNLHLLDNEINNINNHNINNNINNLYNNNNFNININNNNINTIKDNLINSFNSLNPLNENSIQGNYSSKNSISNSLINSNVDNLFNAIESSENPLPKIINSNNNKNDIYITQSRNNIFKNQISFIKRNNNINFKVKKSKNASFELIDFNRKIMGKKFKIDNENTNNFSMKEKKSFEKFKKPFIPNFNKFIKHNGLLIPPEHFIRVKTLKKSLSSSNIV